MKKRLSWKDKFINKIVCGDSSQLLKEIPDDTIDLTITSPPYFQQREYTDGGIGNEGNHQKYIANLMRIFNEVVRVTKEDGNIVFNLGDKYKNGNLALVPYRFAVDATKSGQVKLVNTIMWLKSNPTPRQFKRRLVSSHEPFFHFVKNDNYYYDLDGFRQDLSKNRKVGPQPDTQIGQGYYRKIEESALSSEEKGRAREALQKVIAEVKQGKTRSFRMKIRGIHSLPFGGQEGGRRSHIENDGFTIIRIYDRPMKKDFIICSVETLKGNNHPAIYPEQLVKELVTLLSRKDCIVLDPFMGSGTTAVAARSLGRNFIGVDISPEYCKNARERVQGLVEQEVLL